MQKFTLFGSVIVLIVLLLAFERAIENRKPISIGPNPLDGPQSRQNFSIMSFNVENLFDDKHDPGKDDFSWNEFVVERKMRAIADVVLQAHRRGPDILVLQEIENLSVLDRMLKGPLNGAHYVSRALIEGHDPRGIDTAIASRFPFIQEPVLHPIEGLARGILEVKLQIANNQVVTVFGFHFPSQFQVKERRERAMKKLAELIRRTSGAVIAAGDSNITPDEAQIFVYDLPELGVLSHQIGCHHCRGTYYFQGRWSFFDWIFFSHSLAGRVIKESITTPMWSALQVSKTGRPLRFNEHCQRLRCLGVSDHLPIFAEIKK